MTIDEWLAGLSEDELETLCVVDGWVAGASAMLDALIQRGFISNDDKAIAETRDIIGNINVLDRNSSF